MIYAYVCDKCGTAFEVRATLEEKRRGLEPACPKCASRDVTQDYSNIGMFRGPGSRGPSSGCCGPGSGAGCC